MAHQLLFVCAANVCRSPLMEVTFSDALGPGVGAEWGVASRGTSVGRPNPMCEIGASLSGRISTGSHVSVQVTESEIGRQDLIIAASREERARLARMAPSARTRTFTLKEAVELGAPAVEASERARARRSLDDGGPKLAEYAAILHQRRGRLLMDPEPRVRMPWAKPTNPQDIPDVHHGSAKRHADTLVEVRQLVRTLHGRIEAYLALA